MHSLRLLRLLIALCLTPNGDRATLSNVWLSRKPAIASLHVSGGLRAGTLKEAACLAIALTLTRV